jgi:hypothetical protein
MKLKRLSKFCIIFVAVIGFSAAPLAAQAERQCSVCSIVQSINSFQERAIAWLEAFKEMYLKHLFEENPSYPATMVANSAMTTANKAIDSTVKELSQPQIQEALTQKDEDQRTRVLASMPASDQISEQSAKSTSIFGSKNEKPPASAEGDTKLNVDSLVGPDVYKDETEKQRAYDYIQFLTSTIDPVSDINLSELSAAKREKLDNSDAGRKYKRYVRGVVAARSIALDNLFQMYAERVPVPNLGEMAGMSKDNTDKDASPLQVEHYLATRRVESTDWYSDMTKASPATVQRETLAITAEMNRQLFQLHLDNERIITLLSLISLQNIQSNKVLDTSKADGARRVLAGS